VAEKPDSQDIFFVIAGRYDALAINLRPDDAQPGEFLHADGRVLDQRQGIRPPGMGRQGLCAWFWTHPA
jgi:tRNA U34 2-thiouridine synthase MnmA/TrmU